MACLGRSASSSSIKAAGMQAAHAHIPRKSANHGIYVSHSEDARPALKPGQMHISDRQLYSVESGTPGQSYLEGHRPNPSAYYQMAQHVANQKYSEAPAKSMRPARQTAENLGHRNTSHWRTEYQTMVHEDSVAGAVYQRQFGPSYQAANPASCLSSPFVPTTNQEGYGHYGTAPTHRVNHEDSRMPVLRSLTHKGTVKGTSHVPGYSGFLATNTVNPKVAKVEQGMGTRSLEKSLMTENFNSRPVGYGGYKPASCKNDKGDVKPGDLTTIGATFKPHDINAFA